MRSKLLSKLNGNKFLNDPPETRLLSSITLDFLNTFKYKYSLSVFIPECGENSQFFSPLELSEHFQIEVPAGKSLLECLVSNYFSMQHKPNCKNSASQTIETTVTSQMENRLNQLDLQFISKKSEDCAGIEEKILKVQRECEKRMQIQLQSSLARVREVEITSMKLEEANKYQQLLQKYKIDHEKTYSRELEALKLKEKKLAEQFKAKEHELEHKDFCQRQEYLKEAGVSQDNYNEARRKIDLELEDLQIKKKVLEKRLQDYENKIREVDLLKSEVKAQMAVELSQYKLEFQSKFEQEKRELLNDRIEIEGLKKTWSLDSDRLKNSEDRLEVYTYQLKKLGKENENFKDLTVNLEKTIEQLRKELNIISDSQNRIALELASKETLLKFTKDELESMKALCGEFKDRLDKTRIEHEIEVSKYRKQLQEYNGLNTASDYVIGRKLYWNKLEREQCSIKKEIMEIIKPAAVYLTKANSSPKFVPSTEKVQVKTELIRGDSSSEEF